MMNTNRAKKEIQTLKDLLKKDVPLSKELQRLDIDEGEKQAKTGEFRRPYVDATTLQDRAWAE